MKYYSNLRDAKFILKQNEDNAIEQPKLLRCVGFASDRIDEIFGFGFWPLNTTFRYPYNSRALADINLLSLHYPLLEATTLTNASGGTPIASYTLYPRNRTPYGSILSPTAFAYTTLDTEEITLLGTWGYRKLRPNESAWTVSGDTVTDAPLSASATTLNVASAAGSDALLRSPRFSAGQLIRVESEYMIVLAVTTNALTVLRGAQGSTAATHVATTPIFIFEVEELIQRAAMVWAGLLYKRLGEYQQVALDLENKILVFPKDAPEEVNNILCDLDNETWRRLP